MAFGGAVEPGQADTGDGGHRQHGDGDPAHDEAPPGRASEDPSRLRRPEEWLGVRHALQLAKIHLEVGRALIPVAGILLQALPEDPLQLFREIGVQAAGGGLLFIARLTPRDG